MKKSINQWCFPIDWSWEKVFGLCKKAGFQGIEICVDYLPFIDAMRGGRHEGIIAEIAESVGSSFQKSKALTYDGGEEEFKRVSGMAKDHGLAVSTLLTIAQFYYSLIS